MYLLGELLRLHAAPYAVLDELAQLLLDAGIRRVAPALLGLLHRYVQPVLAWLQPRAPLLRCVLWHSQRG
jgi:hypothetical protein